MSFTSYMPQYVGYHFRYLTDHEMSFTINKCRVSFLEMLGTHPVADIDENEMSYT